MDQSVFTNNNNNNTTTSTNANTWGNPEVTNKPFQFGSNNSQSAFSSWTSTNNTNTTDKSNPFQTNWSNTANSSSNSPNTAQSAFTNNKTPSSNPPKKDNWWDASSNTNPKPDTSTSNTPNWANTNTSAFNTNANTNTKTKAAKWGNANTTNTNWANTNSNTAFGNAKWGSNNWSNTNTNTNMNTDTNNDDSMQGHPPSNAQNNPPNPPNPNPKPKPTKHGKLTPTKQSKLFLGRWQVQNKLIFVTAKRSQPNPNVLIGKCDNQSKHNIKVNETQIGLCTRKDIGHPMQPKQTLHGIIHISQSRKGTLSILWYDDNQGHQHYWNQSKCNKYGSNQCTFGEHCRFAHVNDALVQALQSNNARVLELQQKKQSMKHSQNPQRRPKPTFGNKVYTFNDKSETNAQTKTKDKGETGSVILKSGVHFSPKKVHKTIPTPPKRAKKSMPTPPKKELTSFKHGNTNEGMSFTTTYFDQNGQNTGTFISTQNKTDSNSVSVKPPSIIRNANAHINSDKYTFNDVPTHARTETKSLSQNNSHKPGQCYLMCPISESSMRISAGQIKKSFESDKYTLIKEYSKSNAGQKIILKDVRSGNVLRLTLQYLMNIILNNASIPYAHRFAFLQDRIRAVVKDIYVQHLGAFDKESTIELLEISVRFRVFSHVLICHMDQHIIQQSTAFPKSTVHVCRWLQQDINDKNPFKLQYSYSMKQNLEHLPNILSNLFTLYQGRSVGSDGIEMYCLAAYHRLVQGALSYVRGSNYQYFAKEVLCNIGVSESVRKHYRIKLAKTVIDAYGSMNHILFFKLYTYKLSVMERAMLYPILDMFRLVCIRKMCNNKCVRMVQNTTYKLSDFVRHFGFYTRGNMNVSVDATDFLVWFGGFNASDMNRICNAGLSMDDLGRIRPRTDKAQRFAARDAFLITIEKDGLQRIMQGSHYVRINQRQFMDVFRKIECANDITFVENEIRQVLNVTQSEAIPIPPKIVHINRNNYAFNIASLNNNNHNRSENVQFSTNNRNQRRIGTVQMQAMETENNVSKVDKKRSISPVQPTHKPLQQIRSLYSEELQSMVNNQEWTKLKHKMDEIKHKYTSHPQYGQIQIFVKSYRDQLKLALSTAWKSLKKKGNTRNWNLFYDFRQKWTNVAPGLMNKALAQIERCWFKFQKNDSVYYMNTQYTVINITFDAISHIPKLCLNNKMEIGMFDKHLLSQKQYNLKMAKERERQKKLEQQRMERAQKEQERLRKLAEEKARIQRRIAKIAKEENDRKLRELRAKLDADNERKRAKKAAQELERKKKIALQKCLVIYNRVKLKRFVFEWAEKAKELSEIRAHYRIESNDEILATSTDKTLALLHAHSPIKALTAVTAAKMRKRKTPDLSETSFVSSQNSSHKRMKYSSVVGSVEWDYKQIMHELYTRNKEALEVMMDNSNSSGSNAMDLVFNVLLSVTENNSDFNELIMTNFGFESADAMDRELLKKIYFSHNRQRRLHYCVISDRKIKSIGAKEKHCIRGFQTYLHLCSVNALLDFDFDSQKWRLNGRNKQNLFSELRAQKELQRFEENLSLLHQNSQCSVVIFIKCQTFNIALRENELANNTLIQFENREFNHIFKCDWPLKIVGIPLWNNSANNKLFKPCMHWMCANSPKYPKLYCLKSAMIIHPIFERIFDSKPGLFTNEQKIMFWNAEMDQIIQSLKAGISLEISWPPSSFDNRHELISQKVLPFSNWNANELKRKTVQSVQKLKLISSNENVNNIAIVKRISELDEYWWSANGIEGNERNDGIDTDISSSLSEASTFNMNQNNINMEREVSRSSSDTQQSSSIQPLMEFEQLVNDISGDFDQTLHGLQSCSLLAQAINDRITHLQFK